MSELAFLKEVIYSEQLSNELTSKELSSEFSTCAYGKVTDSSRDKTGQSAMVGVSPDCLVVVCIRSEVDEGLECVATYLPLDHVQLQFVGRIVHFGFPDSGPLSWELRFEPDFAIYKEFRQSLEQVYSKLEKRLLGRSWKDYVVSKCGPTMWGYRLVPPQPPESTNSDWEVFDDRKPPSISTSGTSFAETAFTGDTERGEDRSLEDFMQKENANDTHLTEAEVLEENMDSLELRDRSSSLQDTVLEGEDSNQIEKTLKYKDNVQEQNKNDKYDIGVERETKYDGRYSDPFKRSDTRPKINPFASKHEDNKLNDKALINSDENSNLREGLDTKDDGDSSGTTVTEVNTTNPKIIGCIPKTRKEMGSSEFDLKSNNSGRSRNASTVEILPGVSGRILKTIKPDGNSESPGRDEEFSRELGNPSTEELKVAVPKTTSEDVRSQSDGKDGDFRSEEMSSDKQEAVTTEGRAETRGKRLPTKEEDDTDEIMELPGPMPLAQRKTARRLSGGISTTSLASRATSMKFKKSGRGPFQSFLRLAQRVGSLKMAFNSNKGKKKKSEFEEVSLAEFTTIEKRPVACGKQLIETDDKINSKGTVMKKPSKPSLISKLFRNKSKSGKSLQRIPSRKPFGFECISMQKLNEENLPKEGSVKHISKEESPGSFRENVDQLVIEAPSQNLLNKTYGLTEATTSKETIPNAQEFEAKTETKSETTLPKAMSTGAIPKIKNKVDHFPLKSTSRLSSRSSEVQTVPKVPLFNIQESEGKDEVTNHSRDLVEEDIKRSQDSVSSYPVVSITDMELPPYLRFFEPKIFERVLYSNHKSPMEKLNEKMKADENMLAMKNMSTRRK